MSDLRSLHCRRSNPRAALLARRDSGRHLPRHAKSPPFSGLFAWRRECEFVRTMGIGKSSRFRLLFDRFDMRFGDRVFAECVAEVISDDDLIVVEDDVTDENFDDGFADLHIFNVTADYGIEEVFDHLRREVGIGAQLFLFDIKIQLGNL